jgi:tetratricopeptide (TPR) repeat protein
MLTYISNREETDIEETKRIFKEALRYYNEGKFEEAESGFNKFISLLSEPSSAELWNKKGLAYHYINRDYDAIYCYDRAFYLDNKYFKTLYDKSLSLRNLGKYLEALCSLNLYTSNVPNDYRAKNVEGLIYDDLKNYDRAVKCFNDIIMASEEYVDDDLRIKALNNKAVSYANNEDYNSALNVINHDLRYNTEPFVLDTKAFILSKDEKYEQALALLDEAASNSTNDKFIAYHRGNVYSKLEKSRQALRNYDEAIKIDPRFAEAYTDKAVELSKMGKYDEARNALKKAIKFKPSLIKAHETLIRISLREQSSPPSFWDFWTGSKAKTIAGCAVFILSAFLIIFPLAMYMLQPMSDVIERGQNFTTAMKSATSGSKLESAIPYAFLIGAGILAFILISPVLKTAKIGPLEFSLLDSQRTAQPMSNI